MRAITGLVPTMKLASSSQIKHLVSEVDSTLQKILKLVGPIVGAITFNLPTPIQPRPSRDFSGSPKAACGRICGRPNSPTILVNIICLVLPSVCCGGGRRNNNKYPEQWCICAERSRGAHDRGSGICRQRRFE